MASAAVYSDLIGNSFGQGRSRGAFRLTAGRGGVVRPVPRPADQVAGDRQCQVNRCEDVCGQSEGDSEPSHCSMDAGFLSPSPERLRANASIAGCGHEMAPRPEMTVDHRVRRQCADTYEGEVKPGTMGICHFLDCQTLTGSAFRAQIPAPADTFLILTGTPKRYVKTADNGVQRVHAFCAECGAPVYSCAATDSPPYYSSVSARLSKGTKSAPLSPDLDRAQAVVGAEDC